MDLKKVIKKRLGEEIGIYNRIAIYGTGTKAYEVIELINEMDQSHKIINLVDRSESDLIGSDICGIKVKKLEEIVNNVEAIIIASKLYRVQIKKRIEVELSNISLNQSCKIIDIYNLDGIKVRNNSVKDMIKFCDYISERKMFDKDKFVDYKESDFQLDVVDSKLIAWYLPQYYEIESNNDFYGKGFTEWTNATQAIPFYCGHEQPQIPYDVGFYSLDHVSSMRRQIELAKNYGIYGFCFHYYWFSGQRTMEKPLEMLLEHKELDIPFCINWASESWYTCWHSSENRLIYEQKIQYGDAQKYFDDILPYFMDQRYIKIDGKPLLIIYKTRFATKEEIRGFVSELRMLTKEYFPDLYIMITNAGRFDEIVQEYGADALVEYPANSIYAECELINPEGYVNPYFRGDIYNLKKYVEEEKYRKIYKNKVVYKGVLTSFDNTPRKPLEGAIYYGASPEIYKKWLKYAMKESKKTHDETHDYIFVCSWNEWAEGSHLEPDTRYGYAYLQATLEALRENR